MSSAQIEPRSQGMPPRTGFAITDFITLADIDRWADCHEKAFGGRLLSRGDTSRNGFANTKSP